MDMSWISHHGYVAKFPDGHESHHQWQLDLEFKLGPSEVQVKKLGKSESDHHDLLMSLGLSLIIGILTDANNFEVKLEVDSRMISIEIQVQELSLNLTNLHSV